jgi:hypothetical protein
MGGNLAIKLGRDSDDLVTVDLDHDDHIEPFLQANPAFRNTLRTFGSKGAQFWFYATDDYPKEVRKLEINGTMENAGEFRGGKCISMIWGVHENGNLYSRVNDAPPIKFAYKDIVWPTGWRVIEPKNNFNLGRNGNQNTGPPTGRRGDRRVDWDKFNEALRNGSGRAIVESLVKRWFAGAVVLRRRHRTRLRPEWKRIVPHQPKGILHRFRRELEKKQRRQRHHIGLPARFDR